MIPPSHQPERLACRPYPWSLRAIPTSQGRCPAPVAAISAYRCRNVPSAVRPRSLITEVGAELNHLHVLTNEARATKTELTDA